VYLAPGYSSEYIHLFMASDLKPSRLSMDEDEMIEVTALTLQEIWAFIRSGQIADAKSVTALMLYKDRLNQ
jgi:ADP-ribose pyrophosphatase